MPKVNSKLFTNKTLALEFETRKNSSHSFTATKRFSKSLIIKLVKSSKKQDEAQISSTN